MSKTSPDLPTPADPENTSMLSRKFGREVANYFAGSPLNRLGFLRADHTFLSRAVKHPSTRFLLFKDLQPLTNASKSRLASVPYTDVKPVIGDPYAISSDELIKQYDSRNCTPQLIFLGLDERGTEHDILEYRDRYKGSPYFALDLTPQDDKDEALETLTASAVKDGNHFVTGRVTDLHASDAAIYAEARSLLDWNRRNPFCAQCGQPTLSINAGFKRACPPNDLAKLPAGAAVTTSETATSRPKCATRTGVSNVSFPRTDPTAIMAVINAAGTAVLVGRQKRFPPGTYSCLAGFCEPGESIEEAVRREVYEEAGVHVGRVVIHSTQPWPYPANLMIGAVGQSVEGGETIDLGHDRELEDAKWVPLEQVREMVGAAVSWESDAPGTKMKIPPETAIAHQLLLATVNGFIDLPLDTN